MTDAEKRLRNAMTLREAKSGWATVQVPDLAALLTEIDRLTRERDEARAERDALRDVLLRHGFVPCDIPACNCGSWHARFGYPERLREIADALDEAGHPLSNENGNKPINALRELIAERDALAKALLECDAVARARGDKYGLCDSIDNGGTPYPSQWLADLLAKARAIDAQIEKERSDG